MLRESSLAKRVAIFIRKFGENILAEAQRATVPIDESGASHDEIDRLSDDELEDMRDELKRAHKIKRRFR